MRRRGATGVFAAAVSIMLLLAGCFGASTDANDPDSRDDNGHDAVLIRQVSAATPFADDCGDPNHTGRGAADYEGEPHLAVDPNDADHLVATWGQDRYSGIFGSRGTAVASSFDGGLTWTAPNRVAYLLPDTRLHKSGAATERRS